MTPTNRSLSLARRRLFAGFAALVALSGMSMSQIALAQESRGPITLIVGYPPGGTADTAARLLAEKLTTILDRTVIVDNRPGAGGQIAAKLVKAGAPDGSVLLFTNMHTMVTVPLTVKSAGYESIKDFKPVGNFSSFEIVLSVSPAIGVTTFAELRQWAAKNPDKVNVGVPAPASTPEFIGSAVTREFGAVAQPIAYRGSAPLVQDLLGNQVSIGMVTSLEAVTYKSKINNLATTHRTSMLPGVPSFEDVGLKGLDLSDFLGVYAPVGTSDAVIARYADAIRRAGALPDVNDRLLQIGQVLTLSTPAEMTDRLKKVTQTTSDLIAKSGFKPE